MNPKVDWFFNKDTPWKEAFAELRELALESGLTEELKWGHPCYTLKGKNVFLIHGFKDYCAVLFHKGVLLKDKAGLLVQQTANVQGGRQLRFTSLREIQKLAPTIRAYLQEAAEVERLGLKVPMKKTAEFHTPEEFARALKEMPGLKKAFNALSPGRQRGYLLYFGSAKQAKTRQARIEKHVDRILEGKGLDD
ncbi:MAG TPA: YdeI/OmpD-associated family protein [Flavobacteriales bacterium]|nr:YdeI/OmpD-associated family protein [Flavobacteriales bacterium]HRQ84186.1 YdeI/OmpD-associated family protein [Flavobacteriales bacterium]